LAGGVAELIMTPSLLAGPLGSVFSPGQSRVASFWAALRGEVGPAHASHAVPHATQPIESRAMAESVWPAGLRSLYYTSFSDGAAADRLNRPAGLHRPLCDRPMNDRFHCAWLRRSVGRGREAG
jgi:hypothetical protein